MDQQPDLAITEPTIKLVPLGYSKKADIISFPLFTWNHAAKNKIKKSQSKLWLSFGKTNKEIVNLEYLNHLFFYLKRCTRGLSEHKTHARNYQSPVFCCTLPYNCYQNSILLMWFFHFRTWSIHPSLNWNPGFPQGRLRIEEAKARLDTEKWIIFSCNKWENKRKHYIGTKMKNHYFNASWVVIRWSAACNNPTYNKRETN